MKLPDFSHGVEHAGAKRLAPDIPEQLVLAKRIDLFLQGVMMAGVEPVHRTREFKDYRSAQPGGNLAHISAGYSDVQDGRFSSEIQTFHQSAKIHSHYNLLGDGETWLRTSKSIRGDSLGQTVLDNERILEDMLEYAPVDGEVAELQDKILSARALVVALFTDMHRSAHYKSGNDHYRSTLPSISEDGSYTSSRQIELIDGRVNHRIHRSLSVAALTNFGAGPIDIMQKLVYGVQITKNGSIKSDELQLIHTSSDGLSPQALSNLAESSDIIPRRVDILHKALDDLSETTLSIK